MQKITRILIAIATLIGTSNSYALSITQADAFTAGDNKAALEISTGLVWMDFGINEHDTYAQVESKLNTDYLGWRLPTEAEVQHLWVGLFGEMPGWNLWSPDIGVMNGPNPNADLESIFDIFGNGSDSTNSIVVDDEIVDTWTSRSGFGIFKFESGDFGIATMDMPYDQIHDSHALYLKLNGDDASGWLGTLLVKNVEVPEPSSIILLAMGLLGLGWRHHAKK